MRKLLLLPVFVFALAAAAPAAAEDFAVSITKSGFTPASLTIQNGDTVTWKNNTTGNHQIVADNGTFSSAVLTPGETYSRLFLRKGTFSYHDAKHPSFHGTVTVKATRFVQMDESTARTVTFTRSVLLKGEVSNQDSNGEEVLVQAKPQGSTTFETVSRTTTSQGTWQTLVRPRRNTVFRAVWNNVPSAGMTVFVKPLLRLKHIGRNRFSLGVRADVSLRGHRVLLQRWSFARHAWRSFSSVRLRTTRFNGTSYTSISVFRRHLRHGVVVRALMTRFQALPAMYGPAPSRAIRI